MTNEIKTKGTNKTKAITVLTIALLVAFGGIYLWQTSSQPQIDPLREKVTVYKTETCGCCDVYTKYLDKKGVNVEVVDLDDLTPVKKEYGVPVDLSSCHTSVVAGYVVEGHVPLEVIQKLLLEKPDIRGIALPAMPPGTPGMPGPKVSEWIIYSIGHDGEVGEFITI